MSRLYVDQLLCPDEEVVLADGAGRHAHRVLRLRRDDPVTLFNGRGGEYHGRVTRSDHGGVGALLERFDAVERESPLRVTLAQGVSRGERMDYTIQKAVELGVQRIVPLATRRSVVRLDDARLERRQARWRAIIISACEQCGRNRLPVLHELYDVAAWIDTDDNRARYLLDPRAPQSLAGRPAPHAGVCLVAGAEGGFDGDEIALLRQGGYAAVGLGPRTLRTETAAAAALALMQSRWGDLV